MGKINLPQIKEGATQNEIRRELFTTLNSVDVSDMVEKRQNLTYLSWSNAWKLFKQFYPSATYEVMKNPATNLPYFSDPKVGVMCYTSINVDGLVHEMWLPVLNDAMKPMKEQAYKYNVYDRYKNQYIEKQVEAVSMFDINKTIMRCLVKNMAMFGLGLYIYSGDDLPEKVERQQQQTPQQAAPFDFATAINNANTMEELASIYNGHEELQTDKAFTALLTKRKNEIKK